MRYAAITASPALFKSTGAYPWVVDIEISGRGLAGRVNLMGDWCRCRRIRYEAHGHRLRRPCAAPLSLLRFYFMERDRACAFTARWGGLAAANPRAGAADASPGALER